MRATNAPPDVSKRPSNVAHRVDDVLVALLDRCLVRLLAADRGVLRRRGSRAVHGVIFGRDEPDGERDQLPVVALLPCDGRDRAQVDAHVVGDHADGQRARGFDLLHVAVVGLQIETLLRDAPAWRLDGTSGDAARRGSERWIYVDPLLEVVVPVRHDRVGDLFVLAVAASDDLALDAD